MRYVLSANDSTLKSSSGIHRQTLHFTNIVLIKVHNGVTLNINNGKVTPFNLLDLSAAFDTINQDRHQKVNNGDWFSSPLNISCCVPHGSGLGLLFLYCTIINCRHLSHRFFSSDDTHI